MKRDKMRRMGVILSVVLLIAACMGCAAGKEAAEPIREAASESGEEVVWIPEYKTLESVFGMTAVCGTDNGLYYCMNVYEEKNGNYRTKLFFLDGESQEVREIPFDGEEEGCFFYVAQMAPLSSGELVFVIQKTDLWADDGEERQFLRLVSGDNGKLIAEREVTEELSQAELSDFALAMTVSREDLICLTDGADGIKVYDRSLQMISHISLPGNTQPWGIGIGKEGETVCIGYGENAEQPELFVLDPGAGSVIKVCQKNLPDLKARAEGEKGEPRNIIASGREQGILLKTVSGLVEYDLETETAVLLLGWEDNSIDAGVVDSFTVLSDGRILVILEGLTSTDTYCRAIFLSDTPLAGLPEKETITLGAIGGGYDLTDAVVAFNKKNDRYQIEIVNYARGSNEEWLEAGSRLAMDLVIGKEIDLFATNAPNMKMLVEKGVVEDLYPYLETDPELNTEDYFPSVLNSYTIDGTLCAIPVSFWVDTVFAKTSVVGEEGGWTIEEMMEYVKAGPQGCVAYGTGTKDSNLRKCLLFSADEFMNWESGECRLNEEEFLHVLEFADTFPSENGTTEELSRVERMRNGQILAEDISVSSVQKYFDCASQFGEPITAMGYPTSQGAGSFMEGNFAFAMNAQSDKKEGVWEFLRSFLTEEYYETHDVVGFPTMIREYERQNEKYSTPRYYNTEDGEKEEVPPESQEAEEGTVKLFATQEDVDAVTRIIEECDRALFFDIEFMNIVSEEAAPFFEGQKSAQEVMDIMQSRVQLYMDESR